MRSSSLVLLLAGCPQLGPGKDPEPFDCELGTVVDGAWAPFADGDPAELVFGFQGFLTVELGLSADDPPDEGDAKMSFTPDEGDTVDGEQPRVGFQALGDGLVSDRLLFFLTSGTVDSWDGVPGRMAVSLEGEGRRCVAGVDLVLTDAIEDDPS